MPFVVSNNDLRDIIESDSISRLFEQIQSADIEDPAARDIWLGAFRAFRALQDYTNTHFTDDVGVGLAQTVEDLEVL